jgi:hypothetical protein
VITVVGEMTGISQEHVVTMFESLLVLQLLFVRVRFSEVESWKILKSRIETILYNHNVLWWWKGTAVFPGVKNNKTAN